MPLISSKSITRKKKATQRFRRVGRGIVDKLRRSINSTRLSVADRDVVKRVLEQADKNVVSRFRKGIETIKRQRQKRQLVTQFITGVKTLKKKRKEGQQREIINKVKSNECAICLEQMTPEEATTRLDCRHKYHNECLKDSFHSGHTRCAICRQPISRSIVNNLLSSASSSQQAPPVIDSQEPRFYRTARAIEAARAANPTRATPVLVDASNDTEARAREMAVRTAEARVARANSEYVAMMRRAVNSNALSGNALVSARAAAINVEQELRLARRELAQAIINDMNDIRNPHRSDLRMPDRNIFRRQALQVRSREAIEAQASVGVERALAERAIALEYDDDDDDDDDDEDDDDDDDDEDDEEALLRRRVFFARAFPGAAT